MNKWTKEQMAREVLNSESKSSSILVSAYLQFAEVANEEKVSDP